MKGRDLINLPAIVGVICLILPLLAACAKAEITPDPDAVGLVAMSEQARQVAEKEMPDVVLRQVDTDLSKTTFLFTDKAATKEIDVDVPSPSGPGDRWVTRVITLSPLLGQSKPDVNLGDLRMGPRGVAQAVTAQWPGCRIRGLTLYRDETANDLVWVAFCDTPQGTVSGVMSNRTGVFQPSSAPPALGPITATPVH